MAHHTYIHIYTCHQLNTVTTKFHLHEISRFQDNNYEDYSYLEYDAM